MPCSDPLQAFFRKESFGPYIYQRVKFDRMARERYRAGEKLSDFYFSVPCGQCLMCRLEKSRQWAVRMVHESKMHENNCFLTLTYSPECLPSTGSLVLKHAQNFMKKLRITLLRNNLCLIEEGKPVLSYFMCGEYGDETNRPHYHVCLFGYDPHDKELLFTKKGFKYFKSDFLTKLWSYGHVVSSDLSFDTAAYVARYVTKKITGERSVEHYKRLDPKTGGEFWVTPEFATMSKSPAIGKRWLEKYGIQDCFMHDEVVVDRGERKVKMRPPRYYDKFLEKEYPFVYQYVKEERLNRLHNKLDDNPDEFSYRRLQDKMKCVKRKLGDMIREVYYESA